MCTGYKTYSKKEAGITDSLLLSEKQRVSQDYIIETAYHKSSSQLQLFPLLLMDLFKDYPGIHSFWSCLLFLPSGCSYEPLKENK